ncbi:hypothetical protein ACWC09_29340 [Streptomyces sp. NPDC001617]
MPTTRTALAKRAVFAALALTGSFLLTPYAADAHPGAPVREGSAPDVRPAMIKVLPDGHSGSHKRRFR